MERLTERLELCRQALETLDQILKEPHSPITRDAAIQRFEYTFETLWKAAQLYLREHEGIEAGSPKAIIRASLSSGILEDETARQAMEMADDRNLTVHTYKEVLAEEIYQNLPDYAKLIHQWLAAMEQNA